MINLDYVTLESKYGKVIYAILLEEYLNHWSLTDDELLRICLYKYSKDAVGLGVLEDEIEAIKKYFKISQTNDGNNASITLSGNSEYTLQKHIHGGYELYTKPVYSRRAYLYEAYQSFEKIEVCFNSLIEFDQSIPIFRDFIRTLISSKRLSFKANQILATTIGSYAHDLLPGLSLQIIPTEPVPQLKVKMKRSHTLSVYVPQETMYEILNKTADYVHHPLKLKNAEPCFHFE